MRYAVYFTPASNHPLWQLGNQWLGRDPETDATIRQPGVPGFSHEEIGVITAAPRRYGLHATLKPPFRLSAGRSERELQLCLEAFSATWQSFELPRLEVAVLDDFIALRPWQRSTVLHALADACVEKFDDFRAPPDAAELARRQPEKLGERARANLERWGYPYVFDDFRFHITLTQTTTPDLRARLLPWLNAYFKSALMRPCVFDGLALYVEAFPQAPFRLVSRFPFTGHVV